MALSFHYKTVRRPDGTEVKTPSIPVLLGGKLKTVALLDSGADISAMPFAMAELLELDLSAEKSSAYGIGGTVESISSKMSVLVEKGHEKYAFQIPVKVILGKFDFPVLLGRAGFFDKFVISFDQGNERVSLKRIIR